ncbi:DUF3310 domain-containing protein [Aeromonas veronii]|uniref:DUF3310 domain-containing protein n=1 Tax=Aeromonas veronii TaxID=654 RepID=UPI003BA0D78E
MMNHLYKDMIKKIDILTNISESVKLFAREPVSVEEALECTSPLSAEVVTHFNTFYVDARITGKGNRKAIQLDEYAVGLLNEVFDAEWNVKTIYSSKYKMTDNQEIKLYDLVERPKHYDLFGDGTTEAIQVIQKTLTKEEFKGYLKGNILKYRLRIGEKDDAKQEIGKIKAYNKMLTNFIQTGSPR